MPPYCIIVKSSRQEWKIKLYKTEELVIIYSDFLTYNVIVYLIILQVKAIFN
jgi:hypothetical protein